MSIGPIRQFAARWLRSPDALVSLGCLLLVDSILWSRPGSGCPSIRSYEIGHVFLVEGELSLLSRVDAESLSPEHKLGVIEPMAKVSSLPRTDFAGLLAPVLSKRSINYRLSSMPQPLSEDQRTQIRELYADLLERPSADGGYEDPQRADRIRRSLEDEWILHPRMLLHDLLALPFLAAIVYSLATIKAWPMWQESLSTRRLERGECPKCGYDMTGAPTRRCPECGHEPELSPRPHNKD